MTENGSTAKNKAPAFQFYAGDRGAELMGLDCEAVGSWTRCVIYLWTQGTTPEGRLAQVAGAAWDRIRYLFTDRNGGLALEWMEEQRERQAQFRSQAIAHGKKGGRKGTPGVPLGYPAENRRVGSMKHEEEVEVEQGSDEVGNGRSKPVPNDPDEVAHQFEALWIAFERHGVKAKALSYFRQLSTVERAEVIAKAHEYVRSTPGGAYRTYLEGWINPANRKWERPVVQPAPKATTATERSQSTIMDRNAPFIPLREAIKQKNAERAKLQNPERLNPEPKSDSLPFASEAFAIAWDGFAQMRASKQKPMTEHARSLILAELLKMGEASAITSLENSIRSGWTDVYPPKLTATDQRRATTSDRNAPITIGQRQHQS